MSDYAGEVEMFRKYDALSAPRTEEEAQEDADERRSWILYRARTEARQAWEIDNEDSNNE